MLWVAALGSAWIAAASAQDPPTAVQSNSAGPVAKPDEGIPITDATVVKACGSCHKPDEKQQLSRISFEHPEHAGGLADGHPADGGLERAEIEPATARHVVRYLSNNWLGARRLGAAAFEVERRTPD